LQLHSLKYIHYIRQPLTIRAMKYYFILHLLGRNANVISARSKSVGVMSIYFKLTTTCNTRFSLTVKLPSKLNCKIYLKLDCSN